MTTEEVVRIIKQAILDSGQSMDQEELRQYAEAHAKACATVMERAFFCKKLLEQNNRNDALKLARRSPDLKEEYNALDADTAIHWWNFCEEKGLPCCHIVIPDIIESVISELYCDNPELNALLRRHRLLAFSKASILHRLKVLRKISHLDAGTSFWKEDILIFEKACLEELNKSAKQADKTKDLETLEFIVKELESSEWKVAEAGNLLIQVRLLAAPHREKAIQEKYNEISELMLQSHERMNDGEMRNLVRKWEKLKKRHDIEPSSEVVNKTSAARRWFEELEQSLESERSYQRACQTLENYVEDEGGTLEELDNIAVAILKHDAEIPELLAIKYNSKREALEKKEKQHFILKLVGIAAVLLLIGLGSVLLVMHYNKRQTIDKYYNTIVSYLDNDEIEQAALCFDKLENLPAILAAPEIQDLQTRYHVIYDEEQTRLKKLNQLIAEFEKGNLSEGGLASAQDLVRRPQEKQKIEKYRQQIIMINTEKQREIRELYLNKIEILKNNFDNLQKNSDLDWNQKLQQIQICVTQADEILKQTDLQRYLLQRAEGIKENCLSMQEDIQAQIKCQNELDRIPSLFAFPDRLRRAAESFINTYPIHPQSAELKACLKEYEVALSIDEWSKLYSNLDSGILITDSNIAKRYLEYFNATDSILNKISPQKESINLYKRYLGKVLENFGQGEYQFFSEIRKILYNPLIADSKVIELRNKNYYIRRDFDPDSMDLSNDEKPLPGTRLIKVPYFYDSTGETRIVQLPYNIARKNENSPQCIAINNFFQNVNKFQKKDWPVFLLQEAIVISKQKKIDPILAGNIIKLFTEYSSQGLPFEVNKINQSLKRLHEFDIDTKWMDPDNSQANIIRPIISRTINDIRPLLQDAVHEIDQELASLEENLVPYEIIGIYWDGKIVGEKVSQLENDTLLFQLCEGQNNMSINQIGRVYDHNPELNEQFRRQNCSIIFSKNIHNGK